jgi:hypothetical protein
LTLSGHVTSLRFCFAFFGLDERYRDITSVEHSGTCTIQEPGANAGENPAASLNDLAGPSSNFEDIPAIFSMSIIAIFHQ